MWIFFRQNISLFTYFKQLEIRQYTAICCHTSNCIWTRRCVKQSQRASNKCTAQFKWGNYLNLDSKFLYKFNHFSIFSTRIRDEFALLRTKSRFARKWIFEISVFILNMMQCRHNYILYAKISKCRLQICSWKVEFCQFESNLQMSFTLGMSWEKFQSTIARKPMWPWPDLWIHFVNTSF